MTQAVAAPSQFSLRMCSGFSSMQPCGHCRAPPAFARTRVAVSLHAGTVVGVDGLAWVPPLPVRLHEIQVTCDMLRGYQSPGIDHRPAFAA